MPGVDLHSTQATKMVESKRTQMAVVCQGPGKYALALNSPLPMLTPTTVVVRVVAVSIQPHDWKMAEFSPTPGAVAGSDFAGVVVEVGSSVEQDFKIGDRVHGNVFGSNPLQKSVGAFCQYVPVDPVLLAHTPETMSFEEAATLPTGLMTCGMALYHIFDLPWPKTSVKDPFFVLVNGGSTATGMYAIQLLRLSGLMPFSVCSRENHDLVKSLGATKVFDRHSESCGEEIRNFTRGSLAYALDCISDSESMKLCYTALGDKGGRYLALEQYSRRQHTRQDVKPDWMLVLTVFGMVVDLKDEYGRPVVPEDREFAKRWLPVAEQLVKDGSIKAALVIERPGKFMGVLDGIESKKRGGTGAGKLVYRVGAP